MAKEGSLINGQCQIIRINNVDVIAPSQFTGVFCRGVGIRIFAVCLLVNRSAGLSIQPQLALNVKLAMSCEVGGKASLAQFGTRSKIKPLGGWDLLGDWLVDNL